MFNDDFAPAEDNTDDEGKLEKYSGEVDWSYLKPHFEAGAMLYVDPSLDLKTAGLALARDDQAQIGRDVGTRGGLGWIGKEAEQLAQFVLAQPVS